MSRPPEEAHPERFDPETMGGLIKADHEARYRWAAQAVAGRRVLDAGCGVGYGTRILAEAGATHVVGIDRSHEAIAAARTRLGSGADLVVGDLHDLPYDAGSFDAVVCFEAIEHVEDPERALDEFKRVLRADGILVLSTPNRANYLRGNPYHVHEYLPEELEETLRRRFRNADLFAQHPWAASLICSLDQLTAGDPERGLETTVRKAATVEEGEELFVLAVAGNGTLPVVPSLTMLGDAVDVRAWERVVASERDLEQMRASLSWRVTAPLRVLRRLAR